jgi:hypothetical protein
LDWEVSLRSNGRFDAWICACEVQELHVPHVPYSKGTHALGANDSTLELNQAAATSSISASYDSVGRLTGPGHDLASTTYDQTLGFSYTPANQIEQSTRSNDAYAWTGH